MSVLASVIVIGIVNGTVYFIYVKLEHPSVIPDGNKRMPHFVQDSFATLIQYEPPPNFKNDNCSCSAGYLLKSMKYYLRR